MTKVSFIILTESEENMLISCINQHLRHSPIHEYKVIGSGNGAGLWRKVYKDGLDDSYGLLRIRGESACRGPLFFSICISSDFRWIAAVEYICGEIRTLFDFPEGSQSEWGYLWEGYKKVISDIRQSENILNTFQNSRYHCDAFYIIRTFLIPAWYIRISNMKRK